jgi:hypothetical protein
MGGTLTPYARLLPFTYCQNAFRKYPKSIRKTSVQGQCNALGANVA